MVYAIVLLAVLLHFAIVIVLVRSYIRSRDVGLLWLGVAVFIWPVVSRLLDLGERTLINNGYGRLHPGFLQSILVDRGQMTIGSLVMAFTFSQQLIGDLLLVAILYLSRTKVQAPATQI
jgi:hypothetical protein